MTNPYLEAKAVQTAESIVKSHNVDFPTALAVTTRIWEEARQSILRAVGPNGASAWQKLTLSDKAAVCSTVVRGLLDRERLCELLKGERKEIG